MLTPTSTRWYNYKMLLFVYLGLRVGSFFFPPTTPLHTASIINTLVASAILLITFYLLVKKDPLAWYLIAAEIILGGAGNFLSVGGLSLRTSLLLVSLGIFFFWHESPRTWIRLIKQNQKISLLIGAVLGIAALSALHGLLSHHPLPLIWADTVPYLFFLYYFPLRHLLASTLAPRETNHTFSTFIENCLAAAILGSALFMLFTLAGFSTHYFELQDAYYHWFRDVANGKITALPFNFYRIVLNEQLLLIPIFLTLIDKLLDKKSITLNKSYKTGAMALAATCLLILSLNLTRIYILALVGGLFILSIRRNWQKALMYSVGSLALFFFLFTALHTIASRGQSLGLELFGIRLQSIVSPTLEESSLSRTLLLPKIIEKITQAPVGGHGLGDTVTVYSPGVKKIITTPQFDWGWLEVIDELGLIGLIAWATLLIYSVCRSLPAAYWVRATLGALVISTLTAPIIFHVLGIIWLTIVLSTTASTPTSSIKTVPC